MSAAVVAERTHRGTRCTTLLSAPPISLRETPEGTFLVASGAGPVGGDELSVHVDVGCGASLVIRSAAAQLVLPGPTGAPSSFTVTADVAGSLTWAPEPTVLATGCDHTATTHLDLAPGATLDWRETVVLGRHGEASGSLLQRLVVDRAGQPLLRNEVPLGPRWRGASGAAGTSGARVLTSLLLVGLGRPSDCDDGAVLQVASDAWLVTRLGAHVHRQPS